MSRTTDPTQPPVLLERMAIQAFIGSLEHVEPTKCDGWDDARWQRAWADISEADRETYRASQASVLRMLSTHVHHLMGQIFGAVEIGTAEP